MSARPRRLHPLTIVVLRVVAVALVGGSCHPLAPNGGVTSVRPCSGASACGDDAICERGLCRAGDPERSVLISIEEARRWYRQPDGRCAADPDCGPHFCADGACVPAELVGLVPPPHRALRYWDRSCDSDEECGGWSCRGGWCRPGDRADVGAVETQEGAPCLADFDCDGDGQCVPPGVCVAGVADEPFDFDAALREDSVVESTYCDVDAQCGPRICLNNYCTSPADFVAGASPDAAPTNDDIVFADASCQVSSDCGSWRCAEGWCRPSGLGSDVAMLGTFGEFDGTSMGGVGLLGVGSGAGGIGGVQGGLGGLGSGTLFGSSGGIEGDSCTRQADCVTTDGCVYPGVCEAGAADAPIDFVALGQAAETYRTPGPCADDVDCGPWLCDGGDCFAPDALGYDPPLRGEVVYFDNSCVSDAECGPWRCVEGWCRPPDR